MVRAPMYRVALIALALCSSAEAQISLWQIGGAGLAWDESDTTRVIMAIDANRIRPVYFADDDNMFLSVAGWSELIIPRELGYLDGHQPRLWYGDGTNVNQTSYYDSPLYVDGLRSTYNTARDGWWTLDIGVPVPATRFGFVTPTEGIRSDGGPLNQDPVPVVLDVYDLANRRRARVEVGAQGTGPQRAFWDGRDAQGALLPPGLYLCHIDLGAAAGESVAVRPVAVIY